MEEKIKRDDEIDLREYADFLKRRKWCVIITTVICIAAGWVYALYAPVTYTISAVIRTPSVLSPQNFAGKINEGAFEGDAGEIIDSLGVKAAIISQTDLVRIYHEQIGEKSPLILAKLIEKLRSNYTSEVVSERQNLEQQISAISRTQSRQEKVLADIIKTMAESQDRAITISLQLLYSELLSLKSFFIEERIQELEKLKSEMQNIEVVREPYISKISGPGIKMSLAIAGFTGIIAGIIIGIVKDHHSRK